MNLTHRLSAFKQLGNALADIPSDITKSARNENAWFTEENVLTALQGVRILLEPDKLKSWVHRYPDEPAAPKIVGVSMAGNIPLVGFHDFLCVLIAGHNLKAKLSSQDSQLLRFVAQKLIDIEPQFARRIAFEENLKGIDALIATGSDNTARYFEYYFRNIPHIIRKNRASCAIVLGEESNEEFALLGKDVFTHFGLGCRNVSKLYIPDDFDPNRLIGNWKPFSAMADHHKYANNYHYQRAILLVNREEFIDGEFVILKESQSLVSPVSIVYFERYHSQQDVAEKMEMHRDKLQVISSAKGWFKNSVPFGEAQFPQVSDYADKVDTMKFLERI